MDEEYQSKLLDLQVRGGSEVGVGGAGARGGCRDFQSKLLDLQVRGGCRGWERKIAGEARMRSCVLCPAPLRLQTPPGPSCAAF